MHVLQLTQLQHGAWGLKMLEFSVNAKNKTNLFFFLSKRSEEKRDRINAVDCGF